MRYAVVTQRFIHDSTGRRNVLRSIIEPRSLVLQWRRIARYVAVSSALLLIAGGIAFAYFYDHYSSLVEQRIRSGFWHSRGGVYAAPRRLRVGSRASIASVEEALRRSGYIDGTSAENVFNGNFTRAANVITITSGFASGVTQTARITFAGTRVSSIKIENEDQKEYVIEPELLIGRTESKRIGNRVLEYNDIPEHLRNAIVTAEDQRFFSHFGIDPKGIARAFFANVRNGEVTQGGSTITQQLVKNTFLSPERSFTRKFSEAFLALALENHLSKEEIFALYCNEIYLGQYGSTGIHGVDQAAELYFGKELAELSLTEAAAIAAMIKNPNRFGPHTDAEAAKGRRDYILTRMVESGLASLSDVETAMAKEIVLAKPRSGLRTLAPYFVDTATQVIEQRGTGDYFNSNLNTRIYTTVDTQMQRLAEKAVSEQLAKLDAVYKSSGKRLEASIVAIDPHTGHVLAMVGGRNYAESQFNRATSALRQPGSTFKPFVYATALERGYTPISTFADRPMEFMYASSKPYKPENFREGYSMTNLTLKTALAKSSNVIAVQTALAARLDKVAEQAEEFGFQNVRAYPSMALGTMEVTPLQLAAAYAAFANGGRRVHPEFVDRIVSGDNRTIYASEPDGEQVINERTAYMITDMLKAVVERGTARSANNALGKDVVFVGKTGSSKDGWFAGYTPNLVTVAWIGFDDNSDIRSTGGEIALPLWVAFMKDVIRAMPEYGGSDFAMPPGLTEIVVDPETGMLADVLCPNSERVVLPTHAATNLKCLLHQAPPPYLLADNIPDEDWSENTITIPAEVEEETVIEPQPPSMTYFEEAERANPPKRKDPIKPEFPIRERPRLRAPVRDREPSDLDG